MAQFDELEKRMASNIQSYASEFFEQQAEIDSGSFVTEALDVFGEPAQLYVTGSVTQDEFEDLINMGLQKTELEFTANQDLSIAQAEVFTTHVAQIVKNTANEFVEGNIFMNVDPDEPWPRE